jgi:hypothetical protein
MYFLTDMVYLNNDIWRMIYEYDGTYHEIFKKQILRDIHINYTKYIAKIFVYFFWDENDISQINYEKKFFKMKLLNGEKYTIEFIDNNSSIIFRIHDEKRGHWYDQELY